MTDAVRFPPLGVPQSDGRQAPPAGLRRSWRSLRPVFRRQGPLSQAVVTMALVGLGTATRALLSPVLGAEYAFLTYYPAVGAACWFGGFASGMLACAASVLVVAVTLLRTPGGLPIGRTADQMAVLIFVMMGTGLSLLGEQSRRANRRLAAMLAERVRLVEARDDFLAAAAHELRTPLTTLTLQIELLRRRLAQTPDADGVLLKRATMARTQCQRLTETVERVIDVTQVMAGHLELRREAFDMTALLRDLVERFAPEASRAGCALLSDLGEAPANGCWDRNRVEQAISCLLSNALKYGAQSPVTLRLAVGEGELVISIIDKGIGIDPRHFSRIFDRFERATSTRNYGGLGLGLYLARTSIEAHQGRIDVVSSPGEGSSFIIHLPR